MAGFGKFSDGNHETDDSFFSWIFEHPSLNFWVFALLYCLFDKEFYRHVASGEWLLCGVRLLAVLFVLFIFWAFAAAIVGTATKVKIYEKLGRWKSLYLALWAFAVFAAAYWAMWGRG